MKSNELIHRYLLGSVSAEEVQELECRLQSDESLQDEFLLQAEIDAHLRQAAQIGLAEDDKPKPVVSLRTSHVWKWISGISTLAATILLAVLVLSFPPQKKAMAISFLGEIAVDVSWEEQNIWKAAGVGDLAAIRRELQNSVPVDAKSNDELTPLHLAALFNQRMAAELLLAEGAKVQIGDGSGNTALHMATFLGHTEVVTVLLEANADPEVRNHLGFSARDLVAIEWTSGLEDYYHHTEQVLNRRLDLGRIKAERPAILKLLSDASRRSADSTPTISIWHAAIAANSVAIRQHIEAGTDINAKEELGGSTPLVLAAIFGHTDVAKILIDAGADIELRNNSKATAIHQASFFCHPEIVELLLNVGADASKTNGRGLTPLEAATIEMDAELIGIYRYVYESLNLELDLEEVIRNRRQIAELLSADQPKPTAKD